MQFPLRSEDIRADVRVTVDPETGEVSTQPCFRLVDADGVDAACLVPLREEISEGRVNMRHMAARAVRVLHEINAIQEAADASLRAAVQALSRGADGSVLQHAPAVKSFGDPATLKLVLDALGVWEGTFIHKADFAQSAVYLLQACGADLGYTFTPYEEGPASLELYQDFLLIPEIHPHRFQALLLRPEVQEQAARVHALLDTKPRGLSRPDWSTLLAAWHYNQTSYRMDEVLILESLSLRWKGKKKGDWHAFAKAAKEALVSYDLL